MKVKKIVATVPKHKGVATVVRVVEVGGEEYVDIRDLISTPGEVVEGRGYLFPRSDASLDHLEKLGHAITDSALNMGED